MYVISAYIEIKIYTSMICINIFEQKTHSTCRSKNWLISFAFFFDIGWYKSNKANHFFFFLLKISMWETEDLFVYTSKNNYQWNEFFKLQTQKKSKGYSICLLCLSSSFFYIFSFSYCSYCLYERSPSVAHLFFLFKSGMSLLLVENI